MSRYQTVYFKIEIQATLNLQGCPFGIKVCIYDFYLYFISMNVLILYVYCNIFSQFICMLCLYVFCFINFSLFECIGFHIVLVVLRGKAFYVPSWLGVYSFFELIKFVLVPSRFLYLTNQHIFMILFSNINNYIQIIYHKFYYNFFKVLQIL